MKIQWVSLYARKDFKCYFKMTGICEIKVHLVFYVNSTAAVAGVLIITDR